MKKYFGMLMCIATLAFANNSFARRAAEVTEKVKKEFKETFPFAEKVDWEEFPDRYIVHFEESNVRAVVDYDKDGNYLGSKRYYGESNLPVNILYKIRKKYADKKIFGITEIATDNSIDYYIKMEDATNWITIKSDPSGNFEQVEKYKKLG
jgi:hypothetical protein